MREPEITGQLGLTEVLGAVAGDDDQNIAAADLSSTRMVARLIEPRSAEN